MTDAINWLAYCVQLLSIILEFIAGGTDWRSLL